jgi:hypothetical protein
MSYPRKPLADLGARSMSVRKANSTRVTERGRCIETVVIAFYRHTHSG